MTTPAHKERQSGRTTRPGAGSTRLAIPLGKLRRLCRAYHVRELALFGSALRGDFRADSDVDLLVSFDDDMHVSYESYVDLQAELERLIGRRVDLVPKAALKAILRPRILRSARVLYALR
jgi:uncharacterized protein